MRPTHLHRVLLTLGLVVASFPLSEGPTLAQASASPPVSWFFVLHLPAECGDGLDNDADLRIDACPGAGCDGACVSEFDDSEAINGFQSPGYVDLLLRVGPQTVVSPELHLVDLPALVVNPPPHLVTWVDPDFTVSSSPTLQTPVQGVPDDATPNLDIRYSAQQPLLAGTEIFVARLRGDAFDLSVVKGDPHPQPSRPLVGLVIDARTQQIHLQVADIVPTLP